MTAPSPEKMARVLEALEDDLPSVEDFKSGRIKTLGWQVLAWCSSELAQPDGINKGGVWRFTREQALFVLRFYALNDDGSFKYHRAVLMRVKGWGKSPLMAAIALAEFAGPVRFAGWDADGEPIGEMQFDAKVQVAALNQEQVENTMSLCRDMVRHGNLGLDPNIEVLASRIALPGRTLERITASPRGGEGNRSTFCVLDETHHWVPAEQGPQLAQTLRRNLAKTGGRSIETTNSYAPGDGSVAERTHDAIKKGGPGASGILFDTRNAHVANIYDRNQAFPALLHNYGDSAVENGGWVDLDRIWIEVNDPDTPEHVARRFYFNEQVEGESTWLTKGAVTQLYDPDIFLAPHDNFAVGFKGKPRNDAVAIVAVRLSDGAMFLLKMWEKPANADPTWEVPYDAIDKVVRSTLALPQCKKMLADPEYWQDVVGRWAVDFPDKVEEFWLGKNKSKAIAAVEQFETAVYSKRIKYNSKDLERHIFNCHTVEHNVSAGATDKLRVDVTIRKETPQSKRYISGAQAALLALEAAVLSIEEGLDVADNPNKYQVFGW